MITEAIAILRRWLDHHPDAEACAALEAIELDIRDRDRVLRFVRGRRIPAWQRVREREIVRKSLAQFRALHVSPSNNSAKQWIARTLRLPPSRVRAYLEQLAADEPADLRNESSKLSAADSLTAPGRLTQVSSHE